MNVMGRPVVVIGAGLSGLVCARRLHQAKVPVILLEKQDAIGGRIQTDIVDGFRIDRGFQVMFDAYPHAKLELNFADLKFQKFEPGALVWDGNRFREIHREQIIESVVSRLVPFQDLIRTFEFSQGIASKSVSEILASEESSTLDFARAAGFSNAYIDNFLRPFYGGIFLDRSLSDSSRLFEFYWKMLSEGNTVVPAQGMGAITDQIAGDLGAVEIRTNADVDHIVQENGRCEGVRLKNGETIHASTVVVATDATTACRLTGVPMPTKFKPCTTITYAANEAPTDRPILLLNGTNTGAVNHVAVVSNVSKALAPAGQHLVSATLPSNPQGDELTLAKEIRYQLRSWFPDANTESWRTLAVHRVANAQLATPPGTLAQFPGNQSAIENLIFAGEYTSYVGIDGALKSGEAAAKLILNAMEPVSA